MKNSFIVNYLKAYDGVDKTMYPIITPEICDLLSSPDSLGGQVLYLLTSQYYSDLLNHVIKALGGINKIYVSHWDYMLHKKQFSTRCVVTGERITNINGILYASDSKRYFNYFSYNGMYQHFDSKGVKCPETGEAMNWFIPLFVLEEELEALVNVEDISVSDNESDAEHHDHAQRALPSLKYGYNKLSNQLLNSLRKYRLFNNITKYSYHFNSIFSERMRPIFVKLCLLPDATEILVKWARRPIDCMALRQLFIQYNNSLEQSLFCELFNYGEGKQLLSILMDGYQGLKWLEDLLSLSHVDDQSQALQALIHQHPLHLSCQQQDTPSEIKNNKRKMALSVDDETSYAHRNEQAITQSKHVRFFDDGQAQHAVSSAKQQPTTPDV